jgi:hypothetical protein
MRHVVHRRRDPTLVASRNGPGRAVDAQTIGSTAAAALSAVASSIALAACGAGDVTSTSTSTSQPETSSESTRTGPGAESATEEPMQVRITIGEHRITATLQDSAAADDLLSQLPVTLDMTDHGGVEKTGSLPSRLSLDGQPEGADPRAGDLGYYAPGNDLVLYYGDQSYFPGIVVLGRLDGDAAEQVAELDGTITATVEAG